jgi:hypothetical protein
MAITPAERCADDRIGRGKEHGLCRGTDKQGREDGVLTRGVRRGDRRRIQIPSRVSGYFLRL